jgi:hypothetical protein
VPSEGQGSPGPIPYYEPIAVRDDVYNLLKDTSVAVQVNYSITVLELSSTNSLAALDANQRIANAGWCQTRLNDSRTAVQVRCLQFGNPPQCSSFTLQSHDTGRRNPAIHGCLDDYAPYFGRYKPPDPIREHVPEAII